MDEMTIRRMAIHEAGHFVVGKKLGIRVERIFFEFVPKSIYGSPFLRGVTKQLPQKINEGAETTDYIRSRIMMLMAGSISEHLEEENGVISVDHPKAWNKLTNYKGSESDPWKSSESDTWKLTELMLAYVNLTEDGVGEYSEEEINKIYHNRFEGLFSKTVDMVIENAITIGEISNRAYDAYVNKRQMTLRAEELSSW